MKNKVVLITGCSSGFGFYTALKFARNGYETYASVRNIKSEGTIKLQSIAVQENLPIHIVEIDVTNDLTVINGVKEVFKLAKRIDILVNNAGFGCLGPLELFSVDEIKEQYDTNIFGMVRMVKRVIPIMREQKSGVIINISSINGLIPFPLWSVYSSSKFAIESLTEALRFETAPFGIKVSLVEPGSFLTRFYHMYPKGMNKKDNPYAYVTTRFFSNHAKAAQKSKNSWIAGLLHPQRVADKIYAISQTQSPKLRNIVGFDAHVFFFFRRVLPASIWNWILRKIYNW